MNYTCNKPTSLILSWTSRKLVLIMKLELWKFWLHNHPVTALDFCYFHGLMRYTKILWHILYYYKSDYNQSFSWSNCIAKNKLLFCLLPSKSLKSILYILYVTWVKFITWLDWNMSSITLTIIKVNIKYFDIWFPVLRNSKVHNNFTNNNADYFQLRSQTLPAKATHIRVTKLRTFLNADAVLEGRVYK